MAPLTATRRLLLCCLLAASLVASPRPLAAAAPTDQQVKAVFVFNFSHFVEWPAGTYTSPAQPFVIGVLGSDALVAQLNEAVRGERVDTHPLLVRQFRSADEIVPCQILFIAQAEGAQLERILAAVDGKRTLTVSDLEGASQRGVMIQFFNANNRVRLRINVDALRTAGLTVSSNLLRPAEIVRTGNRE
jgi:uncharacterized protein DUF4154